MANKVCCKEQKVECTCHQNDRDYLNDILASEKCLLQNTATALMEASNKTLHSEIDEIFNTIKDLQQEAYELAWNMGWYTLEEAGETKISQKQKDLQKKLDEITNASE